MFYLHFNKSIMLHGWVEGLNLMIWIFSGTCEHYMPLLTYLNITVLVWLHWEQLRKYGNTDCISFNIILYLIQFKLDFMKLVVWVVFFFFTSYSVVVSKDWRFVLLLWQLISAFYLLSLKLCFGSFAQTTVRFFFCLFDVWLNILCVLLPTTLKLTFLRIWI